MGSCCSAQKKQYGRILLPAVVILVAVALLLLFRRPDGWTSEERLLINQSDSVMTVMVVPQDSAILFAVSRDLESGALKTPELQTLMTKMLRTVTDPSQDGVGIAAPQVGISRRIVCVQRFDKDQEPFECYVNIHIDSLSGPVAIGPEGCLSVPGKRGMVPRFQTVHISYVNPETGKECNETVNGFTAVIFQHECDHLDGILYTDRAITVEVTP